MPKVERSAEELVEAICEHLRMADGEHIQYIAEQCGIEAKYLGDSQFEVKED